MVLVGPEAEDKTMAYVLIMIIILVYSPILSINGNSLDIFLHFNSIYLKIYRPWR